MWPSNQLTNSWSTDLQMTHWPTDDILTRPTDDVLTYRDDTLTYRWHTDPRMTYWPTAYRAWITANLCGFVFACRVTVMETTPVTCPPCPTCPTVPSVGADVSTATSTPHSDGKHCATWRVTSLQTWLRQSCVIVHRRVTKSNVCVLRIFHRFRHWFFAVY